MKIEDHLRNINESIEEINYAVQKGIENKQRTIGFNCSVASVEMLEVYLHKLELINPRTIMKHEWFSSIRRANESLNFDFPNKEKIMNLLSKIEEKRNILCYRKKQPVSVIESVLNFFNEIKSLFEKCGLKWN
jgi:hypothetical protein